MDKKPYKTIGERLKSARMQLNLSRREFAHKCGFSAATLQAWEDGRYLIPTNSLLVYIKTLKEAGLITTKSWFMDGIGPSPKPTNNLDTHFASEETIQKEIKFFETIHNNPIIMRVEDDCMLPFLDRYDYVGGILVQGSNAVNYIGNICIVVLISGETLVRKLRPSASEGCFNLISTNLDTNSTNAFLLNCHIQEIAKVIWHRKPLDTENYVAGIEKNN